MILHFAKENDFKVSQTFSPCPYKLRGEDASEPSSFPDPGWVLASCHLTFAAHR